MVGAAAALSLQRVDWNMDGWVDGWRGYDSWKRCSMGREMAKFGGHDYDWQTVLACG